jgi:DNA-binding response OmpR family regulator
MLDVNQSPSAPRLLVVEDEDHLAAGLKLNFELDGYEVDVVGSAREAGNHLLAKDRYQAIILDVMLPDASGIELCRKLRDAGNFVPVLMLTALNNTEDRVKGLEAGADDYLPKPFELDELLARVRSMLRRQVWQRPEPEAGPRDTLKLGIATIDFSAHEVTGLGKEVRLTQLEFDLLRYFARNPGRTLSRQELQSEVWQLDNYPNTRMVDNFIVRLRRHFEPEPRDPRYFISVRGFGYKFVPDEIVTLTTLALARSSGASAPAFRPLFPRLWPWVTKPRQAVTLRRRPDVRPTDRLTRHRHADVHC